MTFRPLILAAAAAAALTATPSFADSVRVEYKDLDLSSAQGKEVLQNRIAAAARQVCGMGDIATGTRLPSADARKCYTTVLADMEQKFSGIVDKVASGG